MSIEEVKISKESRRLTFVTLLCCLFFSQWGFGGESIILSSGMENTFGTSPGIVPCILWRLDEKARTLEKLVEIDKRGGMRRISAFPEEHLLVVWAYRAPVVIRDKEEEILYQGGYNVSNFKDKRGVVVIVGVNKPMRLHQIELLFKPIFSGWLVCSSDSKISVINQGPKEYGGYNSIIYSLDTKKLVPDVNKADILWDDIRLYGTNLIRENDWVLSFEMDDSGKLLYQVGGGITVPAKTVSLNSDKIKALRSQVNTDFIGMGINTDKVRVLTFQEKAEQATDKWIEDKSLRLIYNKKKKQWSEFRIDVPAATQAFGKWLVFNIGLERSSKWEPDRKWIVNSGDFIFYDIETGKHWRQHIGKDCEILAIWKDNILYRDGNVLYRASFSTDHIGEPLELLSDNTLINVHWAFVTIQK
jgi:hypothetical protein